MKSKLIFLSILGFSIMDLAALEQQNFWTASKSQSIADHANAAIKGSIANIIEGLKGQGAIIALPGPHTYTIEKKLIVPENIRLNFLPGALIRIQKKALLDLQGGVPLVEQQLFSGEGAVFLRSVPYISPSWFGAKGDGLSDDTVPLQKSIHAAAQMFSQSAFPPSGSNYSPPIVMLKSGSYRVTGEIEVYMGITLSGHVSNPFTVGHTRIIMDSASANKNILKLTKYFNGQRVAAQVTAMIQDLEFWYATQGKKVTEPAGGPSYGDNDKGQPIFNGSAIYIAEPSIDLRIKRCNFFQSPTAAIRITKSNETQDSAYRNIIIDESEFDTGNRFIYADQVELDLVVNDSKFFSGTESVRIEKCKGLISFSDNFFEHESSISVKESELSQFHFVGNRHNFSHHKGFLFVSRAAMVNISSNSFGPTQKSTIEIVDSDYGTISSNTFFNSGLLDSTKSVDSLPAAIKLNGSKNMVVVGNSIHASSGHKSGGIVTADSTRRSENNLVIGNNVSGGHKEVKFKGRPADISLSSKDSSKLNQ